MIMMRIVCTVHVKKIGRRIVGRVTRVFFGGAYFFYYSHDIVILVIGAEI